jgi:hypothetical protein
MPKNKTRILIDWRSLLVCILLTIIIFTVFGKLTQTFYRQDEWLGYGFYLSQGFKFVFCNVKSISGLILGQGRVLSTFIYYLFFKFFPLNATPIAIFSIIFHLINSILVFYLSKRIFKKIFPAFLGSLFFVLNSVSQNAVAWPAAVAGTLPSTTLIILSVFTFLKFLEKKGRKWIVLTFLLLYISLFFKETSIYLFLYLPLASLLFEKFNLKKFLSTYWPFLGFFLINSAFRVLELRAVQTELALFLTGSSQAYWQTLLTRAILYPLTSFSLTFVPSEPFLWFARSLTNIYYPFFPSEQFILIAQTVVLDLLALGLSFLIFILIFVLAKNSDKVERKNVGFFVGFMLFSFLPYIIIGKSYAYLESRYFYLPTFAAGVILAWFLGKILEKIKISFLSFLLFFLFFLFLAVHLKYLRIKLSNGVLISQERKSFLTQLSQQIPNLSQNKNVFYITSDRDYYVEGNKIPFQQGIGHALMVLYYDSGKIPGDFLREGYLFEIGGQGYKEIDEKGFGYFSDLSALMELVEKNKSLKNSIYALYYDSINQRLYDITDEVVSKI